MAQLEIVRGQSRHRTVAEALAEAIDQTGTEGTLYLGYPVLASADHRIHVDALLVSRTRGLVAFLLADEVPPFGTDSEAWRRFDDEQDRLFVVIDSYLGRNESLRVGRRLGFEISTLTVFSQAPSPPSGLTGRYCGIEELPEVLASLLPLEERFMRPLEAAIQRVTTIKPPKKRTNATTADSRGTVLKKIEREIANLDRWQKRAAIESPDGPQRIRGLAGSGKTIVLAQKAAYLHAQYPDWRIAVTFQTRSLLPQIRDLIRRFSFEHINDEPDWTKLRVLHAWGASSRDGVYSEIVDSVGLPRRDFNYGRAMFGQEDAFSGVCSEVLSSTASSSPRPLYDAILVDEAQDLPPSFFQLIYRFATPKKRIVWAYDELQKLSESGMPSTDELFGRDENGHQRVVLTNADNQPRQDIILPKCYRNPPWTLAVAHALGLGIYRDGGLVQHFDDPSLWSDIGYRVLAGGLSPGEHVVLERSPNSFPEYFTDLLRPEDAVLVHSFENELEEASWIATQIRENLRTDELDPDDILVVLPDAYTSKSRSRVIIQALAEQGIASHLAGVNTSQDQLFVKDSVAISHVYRAKGNEAPMVYVADSDFCASGPGLITRRNKLFTAITRSRAWVRLTGVGTNMSTLSKEVYAVQTKDYKIDFRIPTASQLTQLRTIHRERTAEETAKAKKAERGLQEFLAAARRGDLELEHLSGPTRRALRDLLGGGELRDTDDSE